MIYIQFKNINIYLFQKKLLNGDILDLISIYYNDKISYFYIPFYHIDLIQKTICKSVCFYELDRLEMLKKYFKITKYHMKEKLF